MKQWNWKHFVLFLLAIPVLNYIASNLGESAGRRDSNSAASDSVKQSKDAPIQTIVSTQDSEGITQENLNLTFLKNFEEYSLGRFKVKLEEFSQGQGASKNNIEVKSEAVYVEVGVKKLAVIRFHTSANTHQVMIAGIVGNELKRITCFRNSNQTVPISYGACADKIEEIFGVRVGLTEPK